MSFSFLASTQPMRHYRKSANKKPWLLFTIALPTSFSLYKRVFLFIFAEDMQGGLPVANPEVQF